MTQTLLTLLNAEQEEYLQMVSSSAMSLLGLTLFRFSDYGRKNGD